MTPIWMLPILALALLQIALGIGALALPWFGRELQPSAIAPWLSALQAGVAGGAGLWLLVAGRRDRGALALGGVLVLIGSSFAYTLTASLAAAVDPHSGPGTILSVVRHLPADAFLALFAWIFFQEFPRSITSHRTRRLVRRMVAIATGVGIALLAITALGSHPDAAQPLPALVVSAFDRFSVTSQYWTLVYGLTFPALLFGLWRSRTAPEAERRRVAILGLGLFLGATPATIWILATTLVPGLLQWLTDSGGRAVLMPVIQVGVLSIPLTTAYAVGVQRVLPVTVLLRAALRYAVARGILFAGAALPFAAAVTLLLQARDVTLGEIFSGPRLIWLLAALAIGGIAWRLRARAMNWVDRRFFREQYDARLILTSLIDQSRASTSARDLGVLLTDQIERALHLESIAVFTREESGGFAPATPGSEPLPAATHLEGLLSDASGPLAVDLERGESVLHRLPEPERCWLRDAAFRLLVPLLSGDGTLLGVIALGPKRSELPFSRQDRELLADIAAAGEISLEPRWLADQRPSPPESAEPLSIGTLARECSRCGLVAPADASEACDNCGAELGDALLPALVLGKFQLEQRIGAGSSGVAYRAQDVTLGRRVAIKTLPHVREQDSLQLRREARAMAAVIHPHLALIFGVEAWRGIPMLIIEYLEGGTLADRLESGVLDPEAVISLGLSLAQALSRTHRAGILHRDVKPSNIGFTADEIPKLLDFGVAHIVRDAIGETSDASKLPEDLADARATATAGVVGTPLYLSPEALAGETPDAGFDLWSLSVVLFEALTGHNPVERESWMETMTAISRAAVRDPCELRPDTPPEFASFLLGALARDRSLRPQTAREMERRLAAVHAEILARTRAA